MNAADQRRNERRLSAINRLIDLAATLDVEGRARVGFDALLALGRDMPAMLEVVLDQAEAINQLTSRSAS